MSKLPPLSNSNNTVNQPNFKDFYGILNPMAGYTGSLISKKASELNLSQGHTKKIGSATLKNLPPNPSPSQSEKLYNIDRISLIEFDVNAIKNNISFLRDEIISELNGTVKKELSSLKSIGILENSKINEKEGNMIIIKDSNNQKDYTVKYSEIKENIQSIEKESNEKFKSFSFRIESLEEKYKRIDKRTKAKRKEKMKMQDLMQQLQANLDNEIKSRESQFEDLREYLNKILSDKHSNNTNQFNTIFNDPVRDKERNDNLQKEEEILKYLKSQLYSFQSSRQKVTPNKIDKLQPGNPNYNVEDDAITKPKIKLKLTNHIMMDNIESLVKALVITHEHFNEQMQLMSIDYNNLEKKLNSLEQNNLSRNQLFFQTLENQIGLLTNEMKENYELCINDFGREKAKLEQQVSNSRSFQSDIEKEIQLIKNSNDNISKSFSEDKNKLENLIRETNIRLKYSLEEFKKIWKKELDLHLSEISANSSSNQDSLEKMTETFKSTINEKIKKVSEDFMQKSILLNDLIDKNIKNNEEKIQQFSKSTKALLKALIDKEQAERISADNELSNKIKSEILVTENKFQNDLGNIESIIAELPLKLDEDINNYLNSEVIPFNVMDNILNQVEQLDLKAQNDKIVLMFDSFHESIMKQLTSLDQAAQNYEEQATILVRKAKDEISLIIESDIKPSIRQISEENSKKIQDIETLLKNFKKNEEEKGNNYENKFKLIEEKFKELQTSSNIIFDEKISKVHKEIVIMLENDIKPSINNIKQENEIKITNIRTEIIGNLSNEVKNSLQKSNEENEKKFNESSRTNLKKIEEIEEKINALNKELEEERKKKETKEKENADKMSLQIESKLDKEIIPLIKKIEEEHNKSLENAKTTIIKRIEDNINKSNIENEERTKSWNSKLEEIKTNLHKEFDLHLDNLYKKIEEEILISKKDIFEKLRAVSEIEIKKENKL